MDQYVEKARVLIEALPYIKAYNGKIVVIKYGGSMMNDEEQRRKILEDVILMKYVGVKPVIVHGGGPEINSLLNLMGREGEFVNGLRVTDAETMEVVQMVLCGKINKELVKNITSYGAKAVGLSGIDGSFVRGKKKYGVVNGKKVDIGAVGEITEVDSTMIKTLIEQDYIPILAPVVVDEDGNSLNVNGDEFAAAIAGSLEAEKFVLLTDVEGVKHDGEVLYTLDKENAENLIQQGVISGGMIPKVKNCLKAIEMGVKRVHILDGRIEHCMLLEFFTIKGVGTMIKEVNADVDEYLL